MLEALLSAGEAAGGDVCCLSTLAQTESVSCFIHEFGFKPASANHPPQNPPFLERCWQNSCFILGHLILQLLSFTSKTSVNLKVHPVIALKVKLGLKAVLPQS